MPCVGARPGETRPWHAGHGEGRPGKDGEMRQDGKPSETIREGGGGKPMSASRLDLGWGFGPRSLASDADCDEN